MTVAELIAALQKMPQDAEVFLTPDGLGSAVTSVRPMPPAHGEQGRGVVIEAAAPR